MLTGLILLAAHQSACQRRSRIIIHNAAMWLLLWRCYLSCRRVAGGGRQRFQSAAQQDRRWP